MGSSPRFGRLGVIEAAIAGLTARISTLEKMLGDPVADEPVIAGRDCRLSKKQLAQRWGESTRTIDRERKKKKEKFPAGELINGRWFWWLSKIQQYERQSFEAQLGNTAADHSRHLRAAEQQKEEVSAAS
jgi:hypothetical protein